MQGDLISRSALIEYINSRDFSKRFIQSKESIQDILITFINEQPTAYDVEKVIEQLEDRTDLAKNFFTTSKVIHINTVRKYIRNGGKE